METQIRIFQGESPFNFTILINAGSELEVTNPPKTVEKIFTL